MLWQWVGSGKASVVELKPNPTCYSLWWPLKGNTERKNKHYKSSFRGILWFLSRWCLTAGPGSIWFCEVSLTAWVSMLFLASIWTTGAAAKVNYSEHWDEVVVTGGAGWSQVFASSIWCTCCRQSNIATPPRASFSPFRVLWVALEIIGPVNLCPCVLSIAACTIFRV